MSLRLIPFLIFLVGVLSGCGGPSHVGSVAWEEACGSSIGTHISRTVSNVDGVVFEGVRTRRSDPYSSNPEIYRIALIHSLLVGRHTAYKYVEFTAGEDRLYIGSEAHRFNQSAGKYRATYEQDDHPRCSKFYRQWLAKYDKCFVFTPIKEFNADYKVIYSNSTTWYDRTYLETKDYRVKKFANDELLAEHRTHKLGWREGGVPLTIGTSSAKSKSCPERGAAFNLRDVLHPANTN
tara:strand:- start:110 stop:817 length:708 start_codon:yes stop_codon:yes gene_type:complete